MMELVCPAGNVEKLAYAYAYGADTAYIGLKRFSLRVKADNFYGDEYERVAALKREYPGRRLFCALNISFHDNDIALLQKNFDYFYQYPIDAFIVQDLGVVRLLQREFPGVHLHLSTQASCVNREAVRMYRDLGFRRVVLGREVSLDEIRGIKDAVPDMELECFAHGAMCIAYSGRCLMSAYLTGRSAQAGFCSHTCRWEYDVGVLSENARARGENPRAAGIAGADGHGENPNGAEHPRHSELGSESPAGRGRFGAGAPGRVPGGALSAADARRLAQSGALVLQERQRPGEFFPIFEGGDFTAVLSSKDLCMVRHLADMKKAGIDAIKIEGRMKSVYYVAMVTRAYRKALDALDGKISAEEAEPFIAALDEVAHRESTTGFYYNRGDADKTTVGASDSAYILAATVGAPLSADDEDAAFAAGRALSDAQDAGLAAMHPAAREAAFRDHARHPEKCVRIAERRAGWRVYAINALNKIDAGTALEIIAPDISCAHLAGADYEFINPHTAERRDWVNADHDCALYTAREIPAGALVRVRDSGYVPGKIRTTGRTAHQGGGAE